jgi:hypothetical protein
MPVKGNIIETRRNDGKIVVGEVSRQRRWQLRNKDKEKKRVKKYKTSEEYKKRKREYMVKYRAKLKLKKQLNEIPPN